MHATWNVLLKTASDPLRTAGTGMLVGAAFLIPVATLGWLAAGQPGLPDEAWRLAVLSGRARGGLFHLPVGRLSPGRPVPGLPDRPGDGAGPVGRRRGPDPGRAARTDRLGRGRPAPDRDPLAPAAVGDPARPGDTAPSYPGGGPVRPADGRDDHLVLGGRHPGCPPDRPAVLRGDALDVHDDRPARLDRARRPAGPGGGEDRVRVRRAVVPPGRSGPRSIPALAGAACSSGRGSGRGSAA